MSSERNETVLSAERPRQEGMAWVAGDVLVSERREDGYYAVLTGVGPDGNWYESDDYGPYPTREAAEQAAIALMEE